MPGFIEKVSGLIQKRPLVVLFGVLLLFVIVIFLLFGGGNEKSANQQTGSNRPDPIQSGEKNEEVVQEESVLEGLENGAVSSSYDNDPIKKAAETKRIDSRPIIQILPYYEGGVVVDIVNVASDGRPVIEIASSSGSGSARIVWKDLVQRTGDNENNYVVVYRGPR